MVATVLHFLLFLYSYLNREPERVRKLISPVLGSSVGLSAWPSQKITQNSSLLLLYMEVARFIFVAKPCKNAVHVFFLCASPDLGRGEEERVDLFLSFFLRPLVFADMGFLGEELVLLPLLLHDLVYLNNINLFRIQTSKPWILVATPVLPTFSCDLSLSFSCTILLFLVSLSYDKAMIGNSCSGARQTAQSKEFLRHTAVHNGNRKNKTKK